MTQPLTEVDIRPWPGHHPLPTGILARHVPTGLSVLMTSYLTATRNREAALRDLALIVAHHPEPAHG